jgi:soluble lytic murein transglycosylase-like protein
MMVAMNTPRRIMAGAAFAVVLAVAASAAVVNIPALSAHYDPIIRQIAARYAGVDPVLIHSIISVESAYDRFAISDKGAQGLMQLMPETARDYGVQNVFNAWDNIEGGIKYLKDLLKAYPGRLDLVLAAYNAGRSAVTKYNGVPPYPETQRYVEKVARVKTALGPLAAAAAKKTIIYSYRDSQGKLRVTNIPPPADAGVQSPR